MPEKKKRPPVFPFNVKREVRNFQKELVELRRTLHRIPEVGLNEHRTGQLGG